MLITPYQSSFDSEQNQSSEAYYCLYSQITLYKYRINSGTFERFFVVEICIVVHIIVAEIWNHKDRRVVWRFNMKHFRTNYVATQTARQFRIWHSLSGLFTWCWNIVHFQVRLFPIHYRCLGCCPYGNCAISKLMIVIQPLDMKQISEDSANK